jgi:hypothetical protein
MRRNSKPSIEATPCGFCPASTDRRFNQVLEAHVERELALLSRLLKVLESSIGRDNFPSHRAMHLGELMFGQLANMDRRLPMKFLILVVLAFTCSIGQALSQQTPDRPNAAPPAPPIPPKSVPSPFRPPTPIPNYPSTRGRTLAIAADKFTIDGKTVQYRGHVRMTTESVIVTADELDYDVPTQSAKATGNVAIQVRSPKSLVVPLGQ